MGSDAIGVPLLDCLADGVGGQCELVGVISQPDRPVGRGKRLSPNPLAARAQARGLTLLQPEKPDAALSDWLIREAVTLVIVMAYGHILRPKLLAVPPLGFVNLHASLLPKYRGAAPIQAAIAAGERETGVSLMRVEPAMDSGSVCAAERVAIGSTDTADIVWERLATGAASLTERELPALLAGRAVFVEQDHEAATYTRKLDKDDGWLDFTEPASRLYDRMRALHPWPGSFCQHGQTRLKLHAAGFSDESVAALPGTVVREEADQLRIVCGSGTLAISELQRPGGKMLDAQTFLRGYPLEAGARLEGRAMRPLVRDALKES